jgi:hypothetical protein
MSHAGQLDNCIPYMYRPRNCPGRFLQLQMHFKWKGANYCYDTSETANISLILVIIFSDSRTKGSAVIPFRARGSSMWALFDYNISSNGLLAQRRFYSNSSLISMDFQYDVTVIQTELCKIWVGLWKWPSHSGRLQRTCMSFDGRFVKQSEL